MEGKKIIFLAGLHRSGTSLLHKLIRSHPSISGFCNTGVPEDEGQHLQTVYEPGSSFGGPGRFVFDSGSRMDESHPLATSANAMALFEQWRPHFDMSCDYLVEKSPPNIVRTRFLQKLFPGSRFIFILRHPLAVSYSTRKWTGDSIHSLLRHYVLAHEIMMRDIQALEFVHVLRYEALVRNPQHALDEIFNFIQLSGSRVTHDVKKGGNNKYYERWDREFRGAASIERDEIIQEFESKLNSFGYSIKNYHQEIPVTWPVAD